MTVKEALQNINIVVAAARMTRQEHETLSESLNLVANKCYRAEALELEKQAGEEAKKEVKE